MTTSRPTEQIPQARLGEHFGCLRAICDPLQALGRLQR